MVTKENLESYFHMWNGKHKRLTRQFEADLPQFGSQKEAAAFFTELFGNELELTDIYDVDGQDLWNYRLVIDRHTWEAGQKELNEKGYTSGADFMMATQEIQIFDDGSLHIVY
ncbi:hypothetical protein GZH47_33505 (plasmid) [Paenibacillus rhizovicinus]|uniref:Uncharacterized protein n=1 Tax=Paenibacillus rhizovicinus TaxID=2704463 RepID=A0A6C0PBN5_9BACL|nr:hypothetical protein [Paenibacillus rhizovicinus]QHW35811.1 hypothetical protein GZH47_33505 [Paenibacillus rhizovicinus]